MSGRGISFPYLRKEKIAFTVVRGIKDFSHRRRNAIRGIVANIRANHLSTPETESIRDNTTERDMIAAATILESEGALRKRKVTGLLQESIARPHRLTARAAHLEAAYACGFINAWQDDSILIISSIIKSSGSNKISISEEIANLEAIADNWGASNYLAKKITFLKQCFSISKEDQDALDRIDKIVGHNISPYLQYSALECIKKSISIFSVARRHASILKNRSAQSFRSSHSLNNLVSTPYSEEDCGGFLLRAVETSLVDVIASVLVILNLEDRYPSVAAAIRRNLSSKVLENILAARALMELSEPIDLTANLPPRSPSDEAVSSASEDRSLSLYRRSTFFLEFPKLCRFRNDIDRVVGYRLIAQITPDIQTWHAPSFYNKDIIKRNDSVFDITLHGQDDVGVDTFYRTYLFLRFVQSPENISSLDGAEIKHIFDSTANLESLLLERELATMHFNASHEARAVISVLALALYRNKSSDPDIDFDYRKYLEDFIIKFHKGNIASFIESIAPENPQVASYLAATLDENTLQKMYCLVNSPESAENIRRDILTTIGVHLNRIEYIIEASDIETRAKVSKLKEYFDGSRLFVDSVAMKKWLISNPSAYVDQFKELRPQIASRMALAISVGGLNTNSLPSDMLELAQTHEYLIGQIVIEAFSAFCSNNEFGIESYLARRIRHNTLYGVMTSPIDDILKSSEYQPIISGTRFGEALLAWQAEYRASVERMRRDLLQFRSENKPNALFNSAIDISDGATKGNIQRLVAALWASGPELLYDLVISFCWIQVAPQLDSAARYIKVAMFRRIKQGLDQGLARFVGMEEQKMKADIAHTLSSVLTQVASWFQVPQTGFVPASISEICNIIDIEHNRPASSTLVEGEAPGLKYYGISVHRIYDCLAVLLHNAIKHGKNGGGIRVRVKSIPVGDTNIHSLLLSVTSALPELGAALCVDRINAAISSNESSADLVTEGYSGIKKVKVITKLNDGASTVTCFTGVDFVTIELRLKAEIAIPEHGHEENIAC